MPAAALPLDDAHRIEVLHDLNILDTAPEAVYDSLVELARSVSGAPMAAISLVDADRQWFKSAYGLGVRQTHRDISFCAHAILRPEQVMVVPDASEDMRFVDNPMVTGAPGIRFYAGAPLRDPDGVVLGTLCVIDVKPRHVTDDLLDKLRHIAAGATAALHLHRSMQELSRLAMTDPLTGLANRAAFERRLEAACEKQRDTPPNATRTGTALLMFDLDRFKGINDLFGHPGGDAALCEVASRLRQVARKGDMLARLGGDEFAMICDDIASEDSAVAIAERVHATLRQAFQIDGQVVELCTSIGIALAPNDASEPAELVAAADGALYAAKRAGRGTTRLASGRYLGTRTALAKTPGRLTVKQLLREALLTPVAVPLHLNFQPILDLVSGRVIAFETLVRWTHSEGQDISPSELVAIAEESGLVTHLDQWILRQACTIAATWPDTWSVAVNMSPATVALMDVVSLVRETLEATGLSPQRLRVEITETMASSNPERLADAISRLQRMGVTMAVDDFGSGYASLAYLRRYPFGAVKVDRCLVEGLTSEPRAVPVMRAVVELTRALGVTAVAEGIETTGQLNLVRDLGLCHAQGYLFGQPVVASEVALAARAAESILAGIQDTKMLSHGMQAAE